MLRFAAPVFAAFTIVGSWARVASADEPPAPPPPVAADEEAPAPPATGNPWVPEPDTPAPPKDHWSDARPQKPPPPPKKPTRWYGWQTLALDAVSTTLMVTAVASAREPGEGALSLLAPAHLLEDGPRTTAFINGSLIFYTLAPAFVHAVHGRGVQAALSPPIRLFAPTIGTVTGFIYGLAAALVVEILDDDRRSFGESSTSGKVLIGCTASGYFLGFIAPMLIDAFAFGYEPIEPDDAVAEKKSGRPMIQWSPRLGLTNGGGTVGLGATF